MNAPTGQDPRPPDPKLLRRRDLAVAAACGMFVAVMVGAAYASVPSRPVSCTVSPSPTTPGSGGLRARKMSLIAKS